MSKILEGIKVLDLSRYISGPYCAKVLGDMGADVIRVEDVGGSDDRFIGPFAPNGEALMAIGLNCNKRGITLNLRSHKGREILEKLVKWADVLVENFSVPAKERLGLTYPELKKINEDLILICLSGYGCSGPLREYLSFDSIAQAESGIMSVTGYPSAPPTRGISLIDFSSGLYGAFAAALALYHRERTTIAQMADISLFDTALSLSTSYGLIPEYKILGNIRQPIGLRTYYCYANGFRAKNGWVYISTASDGIWKRFCKVLGREDWLDMPELKDDQNRFLNHHLIDPTVEKWVSEHSADEVVDILRKAGVPGGRINTPAEVITHPQVEEREMIVEMEYPEVGKFPFAGVVPKFSETPGEIQRRTPKVGEHNEEVYTQILGYNLAEFQELKEAGAC